MDFINSLNEEQKVAFESVLKGEIEKAKKLENDKFSANLNELKAKNEGLENSLNLVFSKLGVDKNSDLDATLDEVLSKKGGDELKFKALENKINDLNSKLENEKTAKLKAIKKSELNRIINGVKNLNPDHKKIVSIELNEALKCDENGGVYFEKDGLKVDEKAFLDEYFKENEIYVKSVGSAGSGTDNGFNQLLTKNFNDMSLAEKGILFNKNPDEYERLKKLSKEQG